MTDESKLTDLVTIYWSLHIMLWEKKVDTTNWPRYTAQNLRDTIDDCYRNMLLLIPTCHYQAIETILKNANITWSITPHSKL